MIQFMYSFCMALLHSFWQAALLFLLYLLVDKILVRNQAPLAKRNFLYAAVFAQLLLFMISFGIYFYENATTGGFTGLSRNISSYLENEQFRVFTPWIFSTYIFIIAFKLIKAINSWFRFKQRYKTGLLKPAVELKVFTEIKTLQFGIKKKVELWLSNTILTPVTFGYFKPVILLPVALVNQITLQQAETLILHELTHIRTNDYLLNWFLLAAETIFFFNPFLVSLCKKVRLEREKNCDLNVVCFTSAPALYAETLLQAERMKQGVPVFQLAAVNRKKQLLQRILFFTNEKANQPVLRFNVVAPAIGLILLLIISTAVIFQSGTAIYPTDFVTENHYLPFTAYPVDEHENGNTILTEIVQPLPEKTNPGTPQPAYYKKPVEKPAVISESETSLMEEIRKPVESNFAMPIARTENDAAREIIIKEEGAGAASVKIFFLHFEDGRWILKPELIVTAREIATDSLLPKTDSIYSPRFNVYPSEQ